jgi:hypothetical protein
MTPATSNDHIFPEFRELHGWYVRTAEVNENFLREPAACESQAAAGLVLRYAALNQAIARLCLYIQQDLALEPAAYDALRRASGGGV